MCISEYRDCDATRFPKAKMTEMGAKPSLNLKAFAEERLDVQTCLNFL